MRSFLFAMVLFCGGQVALGQTPVVPPWSFRLDVPVRPDLVHMPPAYSYAQLGVFCKLDVQLERRLKVPVFFRLGDVRQVEAWEGKGPLVIGRPDR
ncbi:MAG: hypothetical protein JNN32_09995 [Flavobacteriales bacterium]|nr:hypothetical protein [Flavobacteriales bacterium]